MAMFLLINPLYILLRSIVLFHQRGGVSRVSQIAFKSFCEGGSGVPTEAQLQLRMGSLVQL